ncbi:MAG: putative metal-binding motif-containing protein [Archangium sp.]|nr:putative metal-binding motif-containing protein [Archangium sp.]
MLIAPGRSLLRLCSLSLVVLSGCSGKPAVGALEVQVNLEAGLISKCVKVTATDGASPRETMPILLAGKTSPLRVGVLAEGLSQSVSVQALGYSDDGCTTRVATEFSEKADGTFSSPRGTVSVTLRANPVGTTDGGTDAGTDAGVDAGVDAGIDNDGDGFPQGVDCDDGNPAINPNATELCNNGIDDDCDSAADCQDTAACNTQPCGAGSTCVSGVCMGATEFPCNDGIDNNNNGLIDCADPGCTPGTICSDFNACTTGDRCVSDGGCEKVADFNCTNPPNNQCYASAGTCTSDGGASCSYTPVAGNCVDGLACTDMDSCTGGTCAGTQRTCNTPPSVCFATTGACQEPSGTCVYAPRPVGARTCDDGLNCTINDSCDGDGGCVGTAVTCPAPTQCQVSNGCSVAGACLFNARAGACDAGTGAGTCDNSFNCIANPTSLFPFTPSNFTEAQLPADAGTAFTISCATTLNTSGTPAITDGGCVTMPPFTIITPSGGESTVLIRVRGLNINGGQTLTIEGTRPVIFAVVGSVVVDGTLRANNFGAPSGCGNGGNGGAAGGEGGGGGGGFGTSGALGGVRSGAGAGAVGGANGMATLMPIRGGCPGGKGSGGGGGVGGKGGGAVQLTASGSLTVNSTGVITAPGQGGKGATGTDDSGGGGGAGGAIVLEGATVTLNAGSWLSANGGAGGGGEDSGNGLDGAPGNETSTTPAAGGAGPNNAGNGGNGATRTTAATVGNNTSDNDGAGGGGAGLGRIRLNGGTSCSINGTANRSPTHTGNASTGCP